MTDHNVMEVASSAMRGCIIAAPGKKLVVADLSNIEGRVQAWLAGEAWKLQAFRDFDTILPDGERKGFDLYKLSYAKSFRISPAVVTKDQRQKGKVQELALGYQGGVGAFVTFALDYDIDLDEMAADAWDTLPQDLIDEAEGFIGWLHKKVHDASAARFKREPSLDRQAEAARAREELDKAQYGLSREVFTVCDVFKRAWRNAHPRIVAMWKELGDAVVMATNRPGYTYTVGPLKVRRGGAWLRIRLPSGGFLCYPSPQMAKDGTWSYMGINQYSRKWNRIRSYSGKIYENICQAVARDVMAHNMPDIEAAGYAIVLSMHDELLTETPDTDDYSADVLSALLAANKPWSTGLPLAAAGFEAQRYRKD